MTTYPGPSAVLAVSRRPHPVDRGDGSSCQPASREPYAVQGGVDRRGAGLAPRVPVEPASGVPAEAVRGSGAREASAQELAWWQRTEELRCRFERALTRELSRLGLSPSTYLALEQLALHDGQLRITELAQEVRLSPSSVSRVVDRLVRDDLAVRMPSPGDRRTVHGRITQRGMAVYERALPAYRKALALALDAAPRTRGEVEGPYAAPGR
ncbi:MarR family transcriptional regulator [Streptomyces sp. NPDC005389]|uniref:MarR family transcriptional regulator n=1 Tax=unclassified Streptomyces TaxID=2593676 RepID=UPI0033A87185